jgi:4-alpha-glucanotransferase
MPFPRTSGILLHPTSFPSPYGIGDLGKEAYQFVDFLVQSRQRLWQILPLGPTGYGNSPYMSFSAIAGNPLLISPDLLLEKGLLEEEDVYNLPNFPLDKVDFDKVIAWKIPLLQKAAQNFERKIQTLPIAARQFEGFCRGNAAWLDNYALFMALLETQGVPTWTKWPQEIRRRYPDVLHQMRQQLRQEIFFYQFVQYEFFEQWLALKRYTNALGVQIVGDIPIYVSQNSADVWSHPEVFRLDPETGEALEVAGVPPDYFSATGQLWGNPIYNWEYLQSTGFDWWVRRVASILYMVDIIRIDHFRGLESYWSVPAGEETAINGRWIKAPGAALFDAIGNKLGSLPIIAEDLGDIDRAVLDLLNRYGFPGMKILQFAFSKDSSNPYLPFNTTPNSVIYTGTHDNNTTVGWFYEDLHDKEYEKNRFLQYLGCTSSSGISWDLIRLALSSIANQAIIPLQDIFSLGSDARMNMPGTSEGNWHWRYRGEALTQEYSDRLRDMVDLYGRDR